MSDMNESKTPRALTYTEMMNGGRQRMDEPSHNIALDLKQQTEEAELKAELLEKQHHD